MRLKQIKLAGFKSFVDPTLVPFPAQMTAIVGPNGCGKSNIIDAVRWVLGESSAKNLRGDAMTDVIFNGASNRKPVSQASIELVFDNSEGRLQGPYAEYTDIAVKRLVTREAVSTYFLNGNKCRKKDVVELFLGTGLGPRSYAIIEQGMISRLIESKPHELRLFLEEAAGVSKYKERRRETENRIRHTRDNLERLEDVRIELAQQLEKLQRQSNAAQKFKQLKQQERLLKAQFNVMRWQRLDLQTQNIDADIKKFQAELDSLASSHQGSETQSIKLKTKQVELKLNLETISQRLFTIGQAITKAEQRHLHLKENKQNLLLAKERASDDKKSKLLEKQLEQSNLNQLQMLLDESEPDQELKQAELDELQFKLDEQEQVYNEMIEQWQSQSQAFFSIENQYKNAQAKIESFDQLMLKTKERLDKLTIELAGLALKDQQHFAALALQVEEKQERCDELKQRSLQTEAHIAQTQNQLKTKSKEQQQLAIEKQEVTGRLSSLTTLIDSQKHQHDDKMNDWLSDNALTHVAAFFDNIEVEAGWELALEVVLQQYKKAIWVSTESPKLTIDKIDLAPHQVWLLNIDAQGSVIAPLNKNSLASKVKAPAVIMSLLSQVIIDADINKLTENQSGITQQGHWYNTHWHYIPAKEESSLLAWQKEKLNAQTRIDELSKAEEALSQVMNMLEQEIAKLKVTSSDIHQQEKQASREFLSSESELKSEQNQHALLLARQQSLIDERESQVISLEQEKAQQQELIQTSENLQEQIAEQQIQQASSDKNKQAQQHSLGEYRKQLDAKKSHFHQLELKIESQKNQVSSSKQTLSQIDKLLQGLGEKVEELDMQQDDLLTPIEEQATTLQENLELKIDQEKARTQIADNLVQVEDALSEFEQDSQQLVTKSDKLKDTLASLKIEREGQKVRANAALDTLKDTQYNLQEIVNTMPSDANEEQWQSDLDKTASGLNRLGAINLAAIEEYEHQSQRKLHLDSQCNDLVAALDTLEDAIKKIDKETKFRFKETFDLVNDGLQSLFPKVFGGGAAWLELTGEDLLDTGISIMARPPGKRNSTIHLLSGGEKALTALSLVFSIFKLNPAPFCMLDEVDAPLDDANVGRFCRLVQEMSETVQFIFISHNKIAMEMASNLVGVTMQEPGVSRMVAVDIEKAIELADVS